MKINRSTRFIIAIAALAAFVCPQLPAATSAAEPVDFVENPVADSAATGASAQYQFEKVDDELDMYKPIVALARTYGDSITLRWALNSYPEWRYIARNGVDIMRHTESQELFTIDTLARGLKPLSLEAFRKAYPDQSDSLAHLAMGALYGTGGMTIEDSPQYFSSMGSIVEVAEDQKMYLIAAFLSAERRRDLADALALRFTDHNVKKGETYTYFIVPSVEDTLGRIRIQNGIVSHVKNESYKPKPYSIELTDSIAGHAQTVLTWTDATHGLFDVYRRPVGTKEWDKITTNPYTPPFGSYIQPSPLCIYADSVPAIGDYEYAVEAYDAFGDKTGLCKPLRVHFPDLQPPYGPDITGIVIDRRDDGKIFADISFHKDSIERDFTHYVPMYANPADSLRNWRLLSNQYVAPTDTMMRVDVTNVRTGMITIAAVDSAGNMGYAMPKLMRVADMRPPSAPTNLKADAQLDGTVMLTWDMQDTLDLHYYDIFYANSLEHEFTRLNSDHVYTRSYMDSIAVNANERYIYYTVRGVDWSMNEGVTSDTLRVLRPNAETPEMAHLDSMWVDDTMIHARWIGVGSVAVEKYEVYRRREGDEKWNLLRTFNADSVANAGYVIQVDDAAEPDLRRGYEYAVQTVSVWGLTSGLTPVLTARLTGKRMVDFPIKLEGTYDAKKKMTKVAWSVDTSSLADTEANKSYFFCVWRQGPYDDGFNYVIDAPSAERSYVDYQLQPGESAQYRISVRFRDGRKGPTSNTVTVTAPKQDNK